MWSLGLGFGVGLGLEGFGAYTWSLDVLLFLGYEL